MHLRLSPQLLAAVANATTSLLSQNALLSTNALDVSTGEGVASYYYLGSLDNTTCGPPALTRLFAPYGTCFKNYIGPQPNCSIVRECLLHHGSTFQEYTACLSPTVFLYTKISFFNTSRYLVQLYTDDNCTTPFIEFESLTIPFGCQPAQIYDESSTFCGVVQDIFPSDNTTPATVAPWVVTGVAAGTVAGVAALAGASALYCRSFAPVPKLVR